ncbi:serine/threonine-protein kinase AtPK2/AtPK19-like isoform X2 [Hibiscus syriacus]|uniref:serine/threonine-protein kinase AtPK2/AtPK19-like isoform X2 n=1 Tax=Hibiscus syriacus TaxID=106335 RepID=UPI001924B534|nr:serine/threonine-protein kinase AtPK2/AtPK19-like isoform X2 [Hibiscus syriacus]
MISSSSSQKKNLQSLLATNLKKLTITPPSSNHEFDFGDVFGPVTPHPSNPIVQSPSSTSPPSAFLGDPQVIHTRTHSYVGPSPRYTLSSSLPLEIHEAETENEDAEEVKAKIVPEDFEILRVVGQGAFGKVFQVRKKRRDVEDGDGDGDGDGIFAMKVMKKQTIIKKNHVDYMRAERDILTKVVHPFIVQLRYSFQVMLTDFGLAKEIDESSRSNSMCGTTEYMAPEILQSKGHNKDADWWSIGILLYEMLTGQPPFTHANRQKLQQRIIQEKLKLPPFLTTEAHSLLKGMLQKEPSRRLGSGPGGGDEIKKHKWFRSINWKKLEAREIQPKFKPDVSGKDCTANFDKCWTTMPADDSPASTPTAGEHFEGYTYAAPNPWLSSK